MGKLNDSEKEKLAIEVGKYPSIFDKKHLNFKNKIVKENIWKKIAKRLKLKNAEDLPSIWRTMIDTRNAYIKRKKANMEKSGSAANLTYPKGKISLYQNMEFLDRYNAPPGTATNWKSDDNNKDDGEVDYDNDDDDDVDDDVYADSNDCVGENLAHNSDDNQSDEYDDIDVTDDDVANSNDDLVDDVEDTEEKDITREKLNKQPKKNEKPVSAKKSKSPALNPVDKKLLEILEKPQEAPDDPDRGFFSSLFNDFKKIPENRKLEAKLELLRCVHSYTQINTVYHNNYQYSNWSEQYYPTYQ